MAAVSSWQGEAVFRFTPQGAASMSTTLEEAPVKAEPSALEKLLRSDYTIQHEMWRNLHFTDRGIARLQHTIGFFKGLQMCGKEELATELAESLCDWLTRLNGYGGEVELEADAEYPGPGIVKAPAYRVHLSDDGTFGGWSVLWYRPIPPATWRKLMNENPCQEQEGYEWWQKRLNDKARVEKDLTIDRYYYPLLTNGEQGERMERQTIRYSYSFNGGLLFHGFGNQTYSVDLMASMGQKVWWSIHT